MSSIFDEVRQSQWPAVELLVKMGYTYLSAEQVLAARRGDEGRSLLTEIAVDSLMRLNSYDVDGQELKFSDSDIRQKIDELEGLQFEGLMETSRTVTDTIMPTKGGATISVFQDGSYQDKSIRFFDFEHPENNEYHVTVEHSMLGYGHCFFDVVCFVNGIPLAHIECKKSSVGYEKAIAQFSRYQSPVEGVPRFFCYAQLLLAVDGEHAEYGTAGTQRKFFVPWREKGTSQEDLDASIETVFARSLESECKRAIEGDLPTKGAVMTEHRSGVLVTPQDRTLFCLLQKERLLSFVRCFVFYDGLTKKVARYQQYFAVLKMLRKVHEFETPEGGQPRRKGGMIWHTQGSGKSLTMVLFVRALIEAGDIPNSRILLVTDRTDLDKQIKGTFTDAGLKKEVKRMKSGADLVDHLRDKDPAILTTLVQKFDAARNLLRKGFTPDPDTNVFILIDEAHRSQGGKAQYEIDYALPNACLIGFTGTPLLKNDTSLKQFGSFIDTYKIDDALEDGVIVRLIYDGREIPRRIDKKEFDLWAERISEGRSIEERQKVLRRIDESSIEQSAQSVAEACYDIEKHFVGRFQGSGLKGQVVAPDRYTAMVMHRHFTHTGKIKTALVISDENGEISEEETYRLELKEHMRKVAADYSSLKSYEDAIIEDFTHNPEGVELLIVVDKLLTGFDAPCNTVMYLVRELRDHNLLQAIARINRVYDGAEKTCGYVVDYSKNAVHIHEALQLFSDYKPEDVQSALFSIPDIIAMLKSAHAAVLDVFKGVRMDDPAALIKHLDDESRRIVFRDRANSFLKAFDECMDLRDARAALENKLYHIYLRDAKTFSELKINCALQYGETPDYKRYENEMKRLTGQATKADAVKELTGEVELNVAGLAKAIEDMPGSDRSKAEAIAAQTQRVIDDRRKTDERYYDRFSDRIQEILDALHEGRIADIEAFEELQQMSFDMDDKKEDDIPDALKKVPCGDTFYRNLKDFAPDLTDEGYVSLIAGLSATIAANVRVDWHLNNEVKREIREALDDYLYDTLPGDDYERYADRLVAEAMKLAEMNSGAFKS